MRALRVTLAGTVILALLGGLGSAAIAQADTDAGPVTRVTGTVLSSVDDATDEESWEEDGIYHSRGFRVTETVDWSDPRLPSELQSVQNLDASGSSAVVSGTTLLEGPEGYWTGEFIVVCDAASGCTGVNTITGHEAYEGLFAVMRAFDDIEGPVFGDWVFEGLIFEGEMPPMPEALEPATD